MFKLEFLSFVTATSETLYMVFIASFISMLSGLVVGCLAFFTANKQALENSFLHQILNFIINVTRSVPFIILMITLIPLTRLLVGTTIGTNAAIVPLTIAAIPFFARVCENALKEIPHGLIEAAHAMGASNWQIITKVLIPESKPALIRGGTLTIISLIGYSAMAGVVGGGGLGELAINYGYQRFDIAVMLGTVILLIIMVQIIQLLGDYYAKRRQIKNVIYAAAFLSIFGIVWQIGSGFLYQENSLRIGIMAGQSEKVLQVAQQIAKKDFDLNLKIITFTDYVQPNTALQNGSIDANIFQHQPYLIAQSKANHYSLIPIAKTFVYPMGFYSAKIKNQQEIFEGALVAIPNDPSNGGRSLLLLEKSGLIKLKSGVGTMATIQDILENPKHLKFKLLDTAQLPRVLNDADLVAITNDFIGPTGLTLNQAILKEDSDSPYANLIVVAEKNKEKPIFKKLIAAIHSKPVVKITEQIYPNGAAIPAWH